MLPEYPSPEEGLSIRHLLFTLPQIARQKDVEFTKWSRHLLQAGLEYFGASEARLARISNDELYLVASVHEGVSGSIHHEKVYPLATTYCSITAREPKVILAPDTTKHPDLSSHAARSTLPPAYWGICLYFGGAVWGSLSFSSDIIGREQADDKDVLRLLASLIELRLENEELREEINGARASLSTMSQRLESLQLFDALTDLPNRRALFDHLHRELNQLIRRNGEGAIAIVDIDYFRMLNEQHGHEEGDTILCGVANALRQAVRNYDFVARYNGEQFLVWLPDTMQSEVVKVCERMAENVANCEVEGKPITISIGYCAFHGESESQLSFSRTLDKLIDLAHLALNTAKANGRNCAVASSSRPIPINTLSA
ncbi:sensor domain-containing diguanylate cyclase [Enterovibrio nigricans]|uniref:diguanylate cyclase n=1 Tax=Enterovibrio nigricans DSM 22720 TaxID=1121868 RepID=A0A1T4VQ77_9GAMM|nr:sensor domain-containing diguanylate cyclase [Enterovibrio nigricans]PKF49470.1 sensor domain-containing diguanylate cyclase [Enterovibrio nigricans]SKA67069.1 diguanylate cyclase (GGDEF) domain-containing protein [Enterovibrio nigricans DSM 22720]